MSGRKRTWTDEQFITAARESTSASAVLRAIGLCETGSSHSTVKNAVVRLGVDTSHWLGQGHLKGKHHSWGKKVVLGELLVRDSSVKNRTALKQRLLKEGVLQNKCSECGQDREWNGKPLVMVLDHINGVNNDNRPENLRMLCPNCNSQQDTFAGKNNKGKVSRIPKVMLFCEGCGKPLSEKRRTDRCSSCVKKNSVKFLVPDSLERDIDVLGIRGASRKYGVTHTTVARWRDAAVAQLAGGVSFKN